MRPAASVAERGASDGASGYPRTQLDLLSLIRDRGIANAVLLGGDRHLSLACTLDIDGGPSVHAIVASGLYAPWPFANDRAADLILDGPVQFDDGTRQLTGRMRRHKVWADNGFVVVHARQQPQPALSVEFHAAADGRSETCVVL